MIRLYDFISDNIEVILKEWEDFARHHQPAGLEMSVVELRDHSEQMLTDMVADMQRPQTEQERAEKSWGEQSNDTRYSAAQRHAADRVASGFPVDLLVAEYRALRASVLRLWLHEASPLEPVQIDDIVRFNEAVDEALSESVKKYSEVVATHHDVAVGILGHDLRSPLQAVSLAAQRLVQDNAPDDGVHQLGARMHKSIRRMTALIDNLLDFTKSRIGGGIEIHRTHCDLRQIAEQVVDEFRSQNSDRRIHCVFSGECTGFWDQDRIAQVYQNLVANALEHGDRTRPINIHTEDKLDSTEIRVQNFGRTIPLHEQARIFNLFYRQESSEESGARRNLGLGLYIVSEVVSAHGGTLQVSSTEIAGTEFVVSLPRATAAP
ncbi:HAMP domain-containing histidine kinase [Proteobacteria bacterium 005FR1]|nr:HAMP domain-containing histidine kinase [Proteobacteria bacterium 005FR1]